jgi:rhodanese-related sulfurtransferase
MKTMPVIKEAIVVLSIAVVLSIGYAATFDRGLFSSKNVTSKIGTDKKELVSSPVMISLADMQRFVQDGNAMLIDARLSEEFAEGHIDHAVNIPLGEFALRSHQLETTWKGTILITYCGGNGCNASLELAAKLAALGFRNIKVFYGGWQEWTAGKDRKGE